MTALGSVAMVSPTGQTAPLLLWALVALPAAAGLLLAAWDSSADRVAVPLALVTAVAVLGLAVAAAITRPASDVPFLLDTRFGLGVDLLSALLLVTVAVVATLVLLFGVADPPEARPARYHALMLLFLASVLVTVCATTLPTLLLGWELMGAGSNALIGVVWRRPDTVEAGLVAFLTTRAADLGL